MKTKTGLLHKVICSPNTKPGSCKESGFGVAYYLDVKQNKTQVEYTAYGTGYQVCLPMDYDFEKSF